MKLPPPGWEGAQLGWIMAAALSELAAANPRAKLLVILPPELAEPAGPLKDPAPVGSGAPAGLGGAIPCASPIPPADERSRCGKGREAHLMARLRVLFQTRSERVEGGTRCEEMDRSGGHWRRDWVRPHPDLVIRGILVLEEEIRAGNDKANRAAWLQRVLTNWRNGGEGVPQ